MRWQWMDGARALVVMTVMGLAGCGGGGGDGGGEGPAAFVFGRGADAQKLDAHDIDDGESVNSVVQVVEGLLAFQPGSIEVEPALAERYTISEDGRTYTFTLREGVRFHDGTPLDAEAAAWSFRRQMDPEHPAHFASASFPYWELFFADMTEVEVADARTLRFHFSRPNAALLYAFASFPASIISPASFEQYGEGIQRHPVGTGPYRFVSWRPNEAIVYERNADYWGEPAGFERLVIRSIPLNATRLSELRAGAIQGLDNLQPAELAELRDDPRFKVLHRPGANVGYLAFSGFSEKLSAPEVRRAIAMAIDREALVELALDGYGEVADYPMPPGYLGEPEGPGPVRHDPEAARAILDRHPELQGATLQLATFAEPRMYFPDPARVASLIRSDLEKVGLRVEVVNREFRRHLHLTRRGEFDLALLGWMADSPDPSNFLDTFLHSRAAEMGSATNISFYRNPEMDRLLDQALAAGSRAERERLYGEALALWAEDLPLVPLVHGEQIVVLREEVEGYDLHPMGNHYFRPVYWDSGEK